jgi:hypothetical protein
MIKQIFLKHKDLLVFLFITVSIIFIQRYLSFFSHASRDTGVFAYMGDMIRQGQIPYRDLWDHKTPFIYYLNAGLFTLFGNHIKTLSVFEFFWLIFAVIIFYNLAKTVFKKQTSKWAAFLFAVYIASLKVVNEVGMTEIYLQVCAVISMFFVVKYESARKKLLLFLSGIFTGFAFLFKQPGAMIAVPALFWLFIRTN